MTLNISKNLLRRTSLALAALAAAWLAIPQASAATITYSSGETCSYNGMSVDPSGNVTVNCSAPATGGGIGTGGSTPPPPPPSSTVSAGITGYTLTAPATVAAGASVTLTATVATPSATNKINWTIATSGTGCGFPTGISIPISQSSATLSGVMAASGPTSCTVTIVDIRSAGVSLLSQTPTTLTISVTGTGSSPPPTQGGTGGAIPTVNGCPTPAAGTAVMGVLPSTQGAHMANDGTTNGFWIEPTGVITAVALPTLPSGTAAGVLSLTYGVFSAQDPQNYEIQISKCPGVIDPNVPVGGSGSGTQNLGGQTVPGYCYYTSTNPNLVALGWYARPSTSPARSLSQLALGGNCVADESQGTWYANIRYTYTNCAQAGTNKCGEQIQWNNNGP